MLSIAVVKNNCSIYSKETNHYSLEHNRRYTVVIQHAVIAVKLQQNTSMLTSFGIQVAAKNTPNKNCNLLQMASHNVYTIIVLYNLGTKYVN